jgi:speckle-type POZ protein
VSADGRDRFPHRGEQDELCHHPAVQPAPGLWEMLSDGEGADVTFTVDGEFFRAHRCVLAFRSLVFRAQLFGQKAENLIRIDDMEPAIFEALLQFIYTDILHDRCSDGRNLAITNVLVAADRYGVERLRLVCESKLSEAIDVETMAMTLASIGDEGDAWPNHGNRWIQSSHCKLSIGDEGDSRQGVLHLEW